MHIKNEHIVMPLRIFVPFAMYISESCDSHAHPRDDFFMLESGVLCDTNLGGPDGKLGVPHLDGHPKKSESNQELHREPITRAREKLVLDIDNTPLKGLSGIGKLADVRQNWQDVDVAHENTVEKA